MTGMTPEAFVWMVERMALCGLVVLGFTALLENTRWGRRIADGLIERIRGY